MSERRKWQKIDDWPIFQKVLVIPVAVLWLALLLLLFTQMRAYQGAVRTAIREQVVELADDTTQRVVNLILRQTTVQRSLAATGEVQRALRASNAQYGADTAAEWQARDSEWRGAADDSDLVMGILSSQQNTVTAQLELNRHAFSIHDRVMVLNRLGGLVAATYRPDRFYFANQSWWADGYADGRGALLLRWVEPDNPVASEELFYLDSLVPVNDSATGELLGFIHSRFDLSDLVWPVREVVPGKMGGAMVLDAQGRVLASRSDERVGRLLERSWWNLSLLERTLHWREPVVLDGREMLMGYFFLSEVKGFGVQEDEALHALKWQVVVYLPRNTAYATSVAHFVGSLIFLLVLGGVGTGIIFFVAGIVSRPVLQLMGEVEKARHGAAYAKAWVYARDEIGKLADGFNKLIEEKNTLQSVVQKRLEERDRDRKRHDRDLEASAALGELVSEAVDIQSLAARSVNLVRERFGLYYVGLFLVESGGGLAVLQAGTGEAGQSLLARSYRAAVGEDAEMVGRCIARGVRLEDRFANPDTMRTTFADLPYARAEFALPLRSRGVVLGAMSLYSYHADDVDEDMLIILQAIADQIAVAIDSLRLFAERQDAMGRLQRAYGEVSRRAWDEWLNKTGGVGVGYQAHLSGVDELEIVPPHFWQMEMREAWESGSVVKSQQDATRLALPIKSRGIVIGVMDVAKSGSGVWSSADQVQLEQLAMQVGLALENALLYEDTQNRVVREQVVSDATRHMRQTLDIETVLKSAADEIYRALGLEEVVVRLMMGDAEEENV